MSCCSPPVAAPPLFALTAVFAPSLYFPCLGVRVMTSSCNGSEARLFTPHMSWLPHGTQRHLSLALEVRAR